MIYSKLIILLFLIQALIKGTLIAFEFLQLNYGRYFNS
jgi:hypothetical protein